MNRTSVPKNIKDKLGNIIKNGDIVVHLENPKRRKIIGNIKDKENQFGYWPSDWYVMPQIFQPWPTREGAERMWKRKDIIKVKIEEVNENP